MGPSTTTKSHAPVGALAILGCVVGVLGLAGCPAGGLGACDKEPDLTGTWRVTVDPVPSEARDLGSDDTVPRSFTIDAVLTQVPPAGVLSVGRYVRGTLHASDPGYFSDVDIAALEHNNGSKTGAVLGCTMQLNVPIATPVSDDNQDQGPLRISLGGTISAPGVLTGATESSSLVMASDAQSVVRRFVWKGVRP